MAGIVDVLEGVGWLEMCSVRRSASCFKVFSFEDGKVEKVNGGIGYGAFILNGGVELVEVVEKGVKILFGMSPYKEDIIDVTFV